MIRNGPASPGQLAWVDLGAKDPAAARAFYGALLGWSFLGGDDPDMGYYAMAQKDGLAVAGIGAQPAEARAPAQWKPYFATHDVEDFAKRVREGGGTVVAGPHPVGDAGKMVVCQDPTGAFFAAWEAGQSAGMQRFGEMGAVCWVEVYSRDGERARDFYAKLLGLEWQKLEGLPYWPLKRGEEIVCGTMQMPCHYPADLPSHWNVYFAVEDVDASVAKLVSLGGTQISPPFDSPFGRLAFVTDTAGVRFNLMTPAQGG